MPTLLHQLVVESAKRHANSPAIAHKKDIWSYQQLAQLVDRQALALQALKKFAFAGTSLLPWSYIIWCFVLFRIFDIFKPFPANLLDRQKTIRIADRCRIDLSGLRRVENFLWD